MLRLLASELLVDAVLLSGAETTLSRRSDVNIDDVDLRGLCPLLYLPTTRFYVLQNSTNTFLTFFFEMARQETWKTLDRMITLLA